MVHLVDVLNAVDVLVQDHCPATAPELAVILTADVTEVRQMLKAACKAGHLSVSRPERGSLEYALTKSGTAMLHNGLNTYRGRSIAIEGATAHRAAAAS